MASPVCTAVSKLNSSTVYFLVILACWLCCLFHGKTNYTKLPVNCKRWVRASWKAILWFPPKMLASVHSGPRNVFWFSKFKYTWREEQQRGNMCACCGGRSACLCEETYNIGLESLRAHKTCMFVKQQKGRKREGYERKTEINKALWKN